MNSPGTKASARRSTTPRYLANHPEKYEVQRGPERVPLKLYDWFLPALYQQGADVALLKKAEGRMQKEEKHLPGIIRKTRRKPLVREAHELVAISQTIRMRDHCD